MQLLFSILLFTGVAFAANNLETVYEWKYIDYVWESQEQKESYIHNGDYDYKNIVPIDVDKARDGRVFVTVIRNNGVPASLGVVSDQLGPSGPLLKPYPNWSWHKKDDCDSITSVYRVAIDECNKLYVLDTGSLGANNTCPAQVLIFDLGTDQLLKRIKIPDNVAQNKHGVGKLVTPVLETNGTNCELQNLFMADVTGHGLVVYNKERLFRLEAQVFEPEQTYAHISIAGEKFVLPDSLMGMALTSNILKDGGHDLILRPFASRALHAADTRVLSRSTFGDSINFKSANDMLPSQATAMGISQDGTLFFGLTQEIAIGCWNRYRNMTKDNAFIAVQDDERLQFVSGLKVLPKSRTNGQEELWALSNRLQKVIAGTMNFNETNFRVLQNAVNNVINGTKCELPTKMNNV